MAHPMTMPSLVVRLAAVGAHLEQQTRAVVNLVEVELEGHRHGSVALVAVKKSGTETPL